MNFYKQKCHKIGWQAAQTPPAINYNPSQKVRRMLKREVFGYNWINMKLSFIYI